MNTLNQENFQVLMYGWEYPPYISGGLGIACHAIVQALAKRNIKINLVLPYEVCKDAPHDTDAKICILDCVIDKETTTDEDYAKFAKLYKIDSLLHPYLTCEDYPEVIAKYKYLSYQKHKGKFALAFDDLVDFHSHDFTPIKLTGCYGENLFAEVLRYAEIAGNLAREVVHDVIHAHDWMTILAGIKAKSISKKPLVFHIHALEIDRSGMDHVNRQIFAIEKYGMQQADQTIAVSNYTKELIRQHYGIPANKIAVIHNGIDASYISPETAEEEIYTKTRPKMVLFLGRVTHQKGPYFFVEIAKKILAKRQDVQFVIAGSGNLLAEMIERVAGARIGKHVHFTGFLSEENVKRLYRQADVYVMPSVSEPFGISCLEALANNVPVVISKQSGAHEALRNTLSADFWDTDEMAAKILALLDYRALRKELLGNVKVELQNLTWDRAGQEVINLYKSL